MAEIGCAEVFCLPDDVFLYIFSFLDYKDLSSCCLTCRRLQSLSKHDPLWKDQCRLFWCATSRPEDLSWYEYFKKFHEKFGRYTEIYHKIKSTWDVIEKIVETRFPRVKESLQDGISEEELDMIERQIGVSFPDDLRCAYRIHNGQSIAEDELGLFGYDSAAASLLQNNLSEYLMPLTKALYNNKIGALQGCFKLTAFVHENSGVRSNVYITLSEEAGFVPGNVVIPDRECSNTQDDIFIIGNSFIEWFVNFAKCLANTEYTIIDGKLYKDIYTDPDCVAITNGIKVSVATAFLPRFSLIDRPYFFHTYRITMSMDEDAPEHNSCKLESRHWVITNERGDEETVSGAGVVGEYPEMRPGATFSWISFTNFDTTYGNMTGHFTMRNFQTGQLLEVQCPTFHMKCFPYETRLEREERKLRVKKDQ